MKKIILSVFLAMLLFSCARYYGYMNSKLMNQLELGMTTTQVTEILGNEYKISQKNRANAS